MEQFLKKYAEHFQKKKVFFENENIFGNYKQSFQKQDHLSKFPEHFLISEQFGKLEHIFKLGNISEFVHIEITKRLQWYL